MSILTAISRGCKGTMTDGTVRYVIEFEPRFAIAAAELFAMPGTEMGVVALKDGDRNIDEIPMVATKDVAQDHTEEVLDMVPKGRELAKWAGILSNDPEFWKWANWQIIGINEQIIGESEAAEFIRQSCAVTSRAQLDNDKDAAKKFRAIMNEFDSWKKQR